MKKLMMFAMALLTAAAVTMTPQKSQASNAVVDVLKVAAVVALVAIEIDQMNKCADGQLQYCDYYEYNYSTNTRCEYQTVYSTEVTRACRDFGRFSTYDCVESRTDKTMYIKTCSGGFQNRY